MWALAEHVQRIERQEWQKKFGGSFFTGYHEGRRVRFAWHWVVTGHVCVGEPYVDGHTRCIELGGMRWVWLTAQGDVEPAAFERGNVRHVG